MFLRTSVQEIFDARALPDLPVPDIPVCMFLKSIGDGPQKKALSRRFKSYCWLFTDSLIKKLVNVRTKDRARSRALESADAGDSSVRSGIGGATARELQREKVEIKVDVLREMTGFRSSKDLLKQLLLSWLPQVLQADNEEKEMGEREMAAREGRKT